MKSATHGPAADEAAANLQKDLMDACQEANRTWITRVTAEVDLWSQLGTRLMATHSVPEAVQAYQECLTRRMQMAAEDGQRLSQDCQNLMQKITRPYSNGWVGGAS